MGYTTSGAKKIGYTILGGLVGFGLATYIGVKKFNKQEAAYQAIINGKDAEIVENLAEYSDTLAESKKKLSDPQFLLDKYNVVIKEAGITPGEGCADPGSIDLALTTSEQGSCVEISDSVSGKQYPVMRLQDGSIAAGNNVGAAIEQGKKKVETTIDDIGNKVKSWLD